MGCGFSDEQWRTELEAAELALFKEGGVDLEKLSRKYTTINMEGKELQVRTIIYNDDKTKKTLLMTHGYGMSAVITSFLLLTTLAEHYRIVVFDHGGWGLNTKV